MAIEDMTEPISFVTLMDICWNSIRRRRSIKPLSLCVQPSKISRSATRTAASASVASII